MGNPIIKGDDKIIWGTDDQYSLGYVQKVTDLITGEEAEIADGDGDAAAAILFNARQEFSVECVIRSTDTLPERGDDITICGFTDCTVLERERGWENKGALKLTLKAKRWAWQVNQDGDGGSGGGGGAG